VTNSILKIISSVLGVFAAFGLDHVIGKWVAYFTIVWEAEASKKAREAFSAAINDFKNSAEPNYTKWRELRERWKQPK
jgi:hypothetical protein